MVGRLRWEWLILAATGLMLASALTMEHVFGLVPCPLCLMQRVWMIIVGLTAIVSLAHWQRLGIYPLLAGAAAAIGGGFSIRHLYLQTLPPEEVPSCGPDLGYMFENFPLGDVIGAMTRGTGDCAKVDSVMDVMIPAGALLGSVMLVLICLAALVQGRRPAVGSPT